MAFDIKLNSSSGVPFYRQIIDQVSYGVINKTLLAGQQLPTVRQLAVDLQVNLNTVAKAYRELELKGMVISQQGTGTFITDEAIKVNSKEQEENLRNTCETFLDQASRDGFAFDDIINMLNNINEKREHDLKIGEKK